MPEAWWSFANRKSTWRKIFRDLSAAIPLKRRSLMAFVTANYSGRSESTAGLFAISAAIQTNEISKRAASASRFLSKVHSTASEVSSTDPSNSRSIAPQPES